MEPGIARGAGERAFEGIAQARRARNFSNLVGGAGRSAAENVPVLIGNRGNRGALSTVDSGHEHRSRP